MGHNVGELLLIKKVWSFLFLVRTKIKRVDTQIVKVYEAIIVYFCLNISSVKQYTIHESRCFNYYQSHSINFHKRSLIYDASKMSIDCSLASLTSKIVKNNSESTLTMLFDHFKCVNRS